MSASLELSSIAPPTSPPSSPKSPSSPLQPPLPRPNKIYRTTLLLIYLVTTLLAVIDRFSTNISPRQSFAESTPFCRKDASDPSSGSSCGSDFFCEDSSWCLKEGPASVKVFDVLSRVSGRVIITSTSVLFLTMSHSFFNMLATLPPPSFLPGALSTPLLYNHKNDNTYVHSVAGTVTGICTVIHVHSLFLPSIFSSFSNVLVHPDDTGEDLSLPFQISLGTSQIQNSPPEARWGYDDVWRLVWMSVMFLLLFPLSRSARYLLSRHWNVAMWLHVGVGLGYFFDSLRRRSHPHVWIYNAPFVFVYLVDRAILTGTYLFARTRADIFVLDEDYVVMTWATPHFHSDSVCDIFRLKSVGSSWLEWYHPFTTATNRCGSLEVPSHADNPDWLGHKFRVVPDHREQFQLENRHGVSRFTMGASTRSIDLVKVLDPYASEGEGPTSERPESPGRFRTSTLIFPDPPTPKMAGVLSTERSDSSAPPTAILGGEAEVPIRPEHKRPVAQRPLYQMEKQRTSAFSLFRRQNMEFIAREPEQNLNNFTNLAVVRVHRSGATARWRGEARAARCEKLRETRGELAMDVSGGFLSEYSILGGLIGKVPLLVVATGAGAGLVLDVVSFVRGRAAELSEENHVDIVFSTYSLPLLQFVTNSVLSGALSNVSLTCALTRAGDVELDDKTGKGGGLEFSRIDLKKTVEAIADDRQQVFFCGSGEVSRRLGESCRNRGVQFTGAAVEN